VRTRILLALLAVPAMLAACGFHPRRAPELPPELQRLYIVSETNDTNLLRELRRGLESESTTLDDPTQASATLSIISTSQSSRPLVLNQLGQPLLYQVAYRVEYTLVAEGVVLIPPETLTQTRNYNYSVTNGVANQEQEDAIYDSLSNQIAQLIIFRISAVAKSIPAADTVVRPQVATPAPSAESAPATTRPAPAAATRVPPAVTHGPPVVD